MGMLRHCRQSSITVYVRKKALALVVVNSMLAMETSAHDHLNEHFTIQFVGGTFFGPGKMPNVSMPGGAMHVVNVDGNLNGVTPYFNNGKDLPNIASRVPSQPALEGVMSDGTPFNENMDGGVVNVGNGALKLLNVVTKNGPHKGTQRYSLNSSCNWIITTDLALDPGFAPGILVTNDLTISSGVIWIPESLQTLNNIPGGAEVAGTLPSNSPLVGKIGDADADGYLDGLLVGKALIPLEHIFYPGAAVAQSRRFISDIPVSHFDAAALTIIGINNYADVFRAAFTAKTGSGPGAHYQRHMEDYLADIKQRIDYAQILLGKDIHRGTKSILVELGKMRDRLSSIGRKYANGKKKFSELEKDLDMFLRATSEISNRIRKKMEISCG